MKEKDINREELKRLAAEGAMDWIENHYDVNRELRVGVGSGSTVAYSFSRFAKYQNIIAVPTSSQTRKELCELGVEIEQPENSGTLDFDLDGADEVDPELNLIKGGGGCHYREKIVAKQSKQLFIVVDQTKLVDYLGQSFPLPVEVSPESMEETRDLLSVYGEPRFRRTDGGLFRTDNDNVIVDVQLAERPDKEKLGKLEEEINKIDGVVENGFFVNRKADIVFVGTEQGLRIIGDENE
ncbi:ribose-5-phosphate isomerase RpiA [Candidatus Bipolaricaulota bacterium]|nr:ribose-5-phosphate isomerase RpiA [Candidatus Bipolaricaulota bacterium]